MKPTLCAAIAVIVLAAGCGSTTSTNGETSAGGTPPTATAPTSAAPTGIASGEPIPMRLDVAPGRIGSVKAGMTKSQAAATGYFETDVTVGGDVCNHVEPLQWKPAYRNDLDVLTNRAGTIVSIGIRGQLRTTKGVGVGSSLGQVNAAYGDAVSPAVEAGYGQTGVFVNSGDDWLGFLVNEQFSKVSPSSLVTFMEVTKGAKPELMRDGC